MSIADQLGPQATNIGELIGLLNSDGGVNLAWFSRTEAELSGAPRRLPQLFTFIQQMLGPAVAGPPVFNDAQWYPLPNPRNGKTTGLYVVATKPSAEVSSGFVGIGVLHELGYADLHFTTSVFVPIFELSTNTEPNFILGAHPARVTVRATSTGNFSTSTFAFSALSLDAQIYFADQVPTVELVFEDLTLNGVAAPNQSKYTSLSDLVANLDNVTDWFAAALVKAHYWLCSYVGDSTLMIGDLLIDACLLTKNDDGDYALNANYFKNNVGTPKNIASNFLFNFLNTLASSPTPLVSIAIGASGSGIYVVKEDAGAAGSNFGLRLTIDDIPLTESKDGPQIQLQLGKWIGREGDDDSWVSRSLGSGSNVPAAGVSLYLFQSSSMRSDCSSAPPVLSFAPHLELVSIGVDVQGSGNNSLFNINGYVLEGAELRIYLKQLGDSVTFGAAASLDGLGVPLGPQFGQAIPGSSTNPVPHTLLSSGSGGNSGGDQSPVNPAFSTSLAYIEGGSFLAQLYDANGKPTDRIIIPIQRALGPLQCQKLGLGWVQDTNDSSNDRLSLLFDGGVSFDGLAIDLFGLSIGIPVTSPGDFSEYDLDLDGLGLTFSSGAIELSAALIKVGPDATATPPRNFTEYDGEALIKAGTFAIAAFGSYAYVPDNSHGYASLFVFAMLDANLGGPAFFYVTGLAAGFGYNRSLILPDQNGVQQFPLVAATSDPSTLGGLPPDPAKALAALAPVVPPERGEYWLAAGVRFTSFDLINSTALLVVEFGNELEIALLGLSWMSLPPPAAPGASAPTDKYAYAELGIEIKLLPSEGVFSATAILTPNSFVIDPACQLTGGFAFYVWFGSNPNAGQFVLTLGGYHPDFPPPSYFPQVPRLGFNWPMGGHVTVRGEAYFALTPSAVMAGGGLQILFSSGSLKAWFKAQMDALIEWAPFHYELDISVSIGASCRVHLLFVTVTLTVTLGADLKIWGPPMGGIVHIDWSVVSFSIHFGADRVGTLPPLSWTDDDGKGFAQTLLPHSSSGSPSQATTMNFMAMAPAAASSDADQPGGIYAIVINDGLQTTFNFKEHTRWVVRPNHFVFSATTAFPATEVTITPASPELGKTTFTPQDSCQAGSDYFVCVRPMRATLSSSVFNVQLTLDDDQTTYDLAADFDFDVSCHPVPAAKWDRPLGSGQDPDMNKMLPGRLLGLENIKPKTTTLSPSGTNLLEVDIGSAFVDITVDNEEGYSPNELPLNAGATPVGPVPVLDAQALPKIAASLKDPNVIQSRTNIFSALRQFGIDPGTNDALANYASDPAAVLTGNPLLISTSA